MNTLEYLQLTRHQKERTKQTDDLSHWGIFVYGNKNNGELRDWINNKLYKKLIFKDGRIIKKIK